MEFQDQYLFLRHIAAALSQGAFAAHLLQLHFMVIIRYALMNERSPAITMAGSVPRPFPAIPATKGLSALSVPGLVHP